MNYIPIMYQKCVQTSLWSLHWTTDMTKVELIISFYSFASLLHAKLARPESIYLSNFHPNHLNKYFLVFHFCPINLKKNLMIFSRVLTHFRNLWLDTGNQLTIDSEFLQIRVLNISLFWNLTTFLPKFSQICSNVSLIIVSLKDCFLIYYQIITTKSNLIYGVFIEVIFHSYHNYNNNKDIDKLQLIRKLSTNHKSFVAIICINWCSFTKHL